MKAFISIGMIISVLVFALLAAGPAGAAENNGFVSKSIFTKHFQETLFDITEHAAYSVEVLLDEKEYKIGKDVVGIVIHNAHDEDVKGAELRIVLKNLTTGEEAPSTFGVIDRGNGLYIISNLNLQREGRWDLSITVKKNGVKDRVKFVLPDALKHRLSKGRYSP